MRNFVFAAVMFLWTGGSMSAWAQDPCDYSELLDRPRGIPDVMKEALLHAKSCRAASLSGESAPCTTAALSRGI
jgi:hypothetical protein